MTTNYIETLSAQQAAWCKANGIAFTHNAKHKISHFSKLGVFVDVDFRNSNPSRSVYVTRLPSVELDGPDCNDGELVDVVELPSLKAALAHLAGLVAS